MWILHITATARSSAHTQARQDPHIECDEQRQDQWHDYITSGQTRYLQNAIPPMKIDTTHADKWSKPEYIPQAGVCKRRSMT